MYWYQYDEGFKEAPGDYQSQAELLDGKFVPINRSICIEF